MVGRQFQVCHHPRRIPEIDRTVYHERILSGGMDMVFVEQDLIVLHYDLLIVHPETRSYSSHEHRGRIHLDISVHFGRLTAALYRHISFQYTVQRCHIIGDKRIYHIQRQMRHVERSVQMIFFPHLIKGSRRHHFVLIAEEVHIDLVLVIRQREINGTEHQFPYPSAFIDQIVDIRIDHHQERTVRRRVLHVGTQYPLHGRYLRKCFRDNVQVDLAQFEMQFLHLVLFG